MPGLTTDTRIFRGYYQMVVAALAVAAVEAAEYRMAARPRGEEVNLPDQHAVPRVREQAPP